MPEETLTLPLADCAAGTLQAHTIAGREIVVCATKDGVFALDNICTHAFARLNEGRLRGTRLICPLHGAGFDVRDGRALGAPASRPLTTHRVHSVEDRVEITVSTPTTSAP
jgi:3-phenylpropionate/trans-cinnamate dioxygenase ferredoxin subunit